LTLPDFRVPLPEEIRRLTPYVPGKPIEELERELGITGAVKLASNENPLGPSRSVLEVVQEAFRHVHRYPDGSAFRLKRSLSAYLQVPEDRLVLGNGSNELLVLLAECVVRPGDEVVFARPAFVVYPLVTQLLRGIPRVVPLKDDAHDLEAFADALSPRTRLVFVCNPNNPTGTIVTRNAIEALLERTSPETLVVLDEAYYEYVDDPAYFESLHLLERHPNVAVLRTFSKAFGLAGLRVGYGVVHPVLADAVQRARQPFNVNQMALAAAEAALLDRDHVRKVVDLNRRMRRLLEQGLARLGVRVAPSQANFVYFRVPSAFKVYEALLAKGVIVRPMGDEALRVTTGTEEETRRFLDAFAEVVRW
jgi:histidinol-phosphate aminotransferase